MKVRELIEALQKMPPDAEVERYVYREGDADSLPYEDAVSIGCVEPLGNEIAAGSVVIR